MQVVTRSGKLEKVSFDKIIDRLDPLCKDLDPKYVDPILVARDTISNMFNKITTKQLDNLSADICASKISVHPDFNKLAARIAVSNLHKETGEKYSEIVQELYDLNLVSKSFYEFVMNNANELQQFIDYSRDFLFDFFGFKTLERSYLFREKAKLNRVIERPQHMWLRVSIQVHGLMNDIPVETKLKLIKQTYDAMSLQYFTHATPTLFNSGTNRPQMSSCFLMSIDDNIENIFKVAGDMGKISKFAGGIGVHIHSIRAKGSLIRGTNGNSSGIIPLCKHIESIAKYINQGGKRNGSIAIYLEPYHADIFDFIDLRKNMGDENLRARDLFLALWIPDLFMKRVMEKGKWSLMCPDKCPGLSDVYGDEFEQLYIKYESEKRYNRQIEAEDLWKHIIESQMETGMPYITYKDHVNRKSNQKNIGVIKSSNLCVSGDTMILTSTGYYSIKELKDKEVQVWNGEEWSTTQVKQTGINQKLINIKFNNFLEIKCTEYHKFYIETAKRPAYKSIPKVIEAKDLKTDMKIIRIPNINPVKDNNDILDMAYTHGLFCADGTYSHNNQSDQRCKYKKIVGSEFCGRHQNNKKIYNTDDNICSANIGEKKPILSLYDSKIKLLEYIEYISKGEILCQGNSQKVTLTLSCKLKPKYYVPINNSTKSKINWLEGYLDGDGCVIENNGIKNIQSVSINLEFLRNIVYMLQTLGIQSTLGHAQNIRNVTLPDGKGASKEYECKECYRLNIDSTSIIQLIKLGFNPKRLDISNCKLPHHKKNRYTKISSVEDNNEYGDTYCFNEPKRHMGVFNGVIAGNCNEIVEVSNTQETAVCNLGSLCLRMFIEEDSKGNKVYNFEKLRYYTKILTENLNNVIDLNYYPIPETEYSNLRHRPIGIGVQGLADVFCIMKYPFESEKARELNRKIFEHIYFAALEKSNELAKKHEAYQTFKGSPFNEGLLQWHLWNVDPKSLSPELNWNSLIENIKKYGTRNSLLTACMPTASTSQIMKNYECFEPYSSNLFVRTTLAGEYIIVNEHLVRELITNNLWTKEIYDEIIYFNGSIQKIKEIPDNIKEVYKTAFEIKGKCIVDLSIDRGPFIDQTQSLNIFQDVPNTSKLTSSHFYGWKNGLKTGMYYLRTRPAVDAIKFGIDPVVTKRIKDKYENNGNNNNNTYNSTNKFNTYEITKINVQNQSISDNTQQSTSSLSSSSSSLSSSKPLICKWKKPGEPNNEPCDMCSA